MPINNKPKILTPALKSLKKGIEIALKQSVISSKKHKPGEILQKFLTEEERNSLKSLKSDDIKHDGIPIPQKQKINKQ